MQTAVSARIEMIRTAIRRERRAVAALKTDREAAVRELDEIEHMLAPASRDLRDWALWLDGVEDRLSQAIKNRSDRGQQK